jgi:MFS family permease
MNQALTPSSAVRPRFLLWRLSALMFLQYAAAGALLPLFSSHLTDLGFSPQQLAWACAAHPLAALVGPLVAGQVADRWFPAERCLVVCALAAAAALWVLAELSTPAGVFVAHLAVWLVLTPGITLGTAICMIHLASPENEFGKVRLWGTVGWMVPGWLLGSWFAWSQRGLADAIRLASLLACVLAAYALTLPHTPPQRRARGWLAPLAALYLLRGRTFAVCFISLFGVCLTLPFTGQVTPLFLTHLGLSRPWLSRALTIAQTTEIVALALLPMLLLRLGVRGTMLLGLGSWALALTILTVGSPVGLVISSLTLNGLCICCFIVVAQVYVNRKARGDVRTSAQALLAVGNGAGMLAGNLFVGWIRQTVNLNFAHTFAAGAAIAWTLVALFFIGFWEEETA